MRHRMLLAALLLSAALPASAAQVSRDDLLAAGSMELTLESGGIERTYLLYVPTSYNGSALPLVLNFHGVTSTGASQEEYTDFSNKAEAEGFIVAHPDGYGNSWNAGWCCSPATEDGIDDVQFARDLVAAIEADYAVDSDRIFATGFSNGGFMSHRLGCEASDLFAAIAPASGQIAIESCAPERPVPVISTHGTADFIVPYKSGQTSIEEWADLNACPGTSSTVYRKGGASCVLYTDCEAGADVELCTVKGMGHVWPADDRGMGWIDATDTFWAFFEAHPFGE